MKLTATLLTSAALLLGPLAFAQEHDGHEAHGAHDKAAAHAGAHDEGPVDEAKQIAQQIPCYPLKTCVVSGEPLGGEMGDIVDVLHEGRLVRLCCKMCKKDLAKDPAPIMAKIDAAIIAAQGPTYPLETCPISGEKLGSKGAPIDHIVGTRLVRLCCKSCIKEVDKAPGKALVEVNKALIAAQKPNYPLDTCPVSGEKLGDDAVDFLYGTRLVRLCCRKCVKAVGEHPEPVLAKLDAAAKAK